MFDINYKTLFILDHCGTFNEPSGVFIELETSKPPPAQNSSSRLPNYFPLFIPPIIKSLWTITVENVLEYSRIVWDVYSDERRLRFMIYNPDDTLPLNRWDECQNLTQISEQFAKVGQPKLANNGSIQNAIDKAIIALSEPTQEQIQAAMISKSSDKVTNRGRIILVTSCTQDFGLEDFFLQAVTQHNRSASASDHLLPIHEVDFVILSVHPKNKERAARVIPRPRFDISATVHSETWIVTPETIYDKTIELCSIHHDLVTTTVTGIPMKEEQNSLCSSNYDVPLFHPRLPTTSAETMVLKWSSPVNPKQGLGTSHPCASACRVTPVDIISRPSTCLTNFVVGGRSVWLETPKRGKGTAASTSHVLTPHGSEIWMHVMETSRNILEDPPSISEGLGGRVTDYRIPDFVEFMKLNILAPYTEPPPRSVIKHGRKPSRDEKFKPNELAKERLKRKTEYWPLTMSGSLLCPMAVHLEPLLKLMPKDNLDDMEQVECDKTLWSLMSIEARGDPPPLPSPHHKKGHKRDEQWKAVYNEIEKFLQANLHSPAHEKVLKCFQDSRQQETNGKPRSNLDQILDEVSKIGSRTKTVIADSPMSPTSPTPPPLNLKAGIKDDSSNSGTKMNLLDLWRTRTEKPDFRSLPSQIRLYPHLEPQQQTLKEEQPAAHKTAKAS